ncbi:hypothetical protein SAMN02745220_03109 [Desulfopila aestuarii DSM 18488]|uniref:Uncharacterized protein n=1 Tax=Desulfopila aestuarii DSM 18488 TaxID=1121416 RepID=A0A1M7YB90_9BACT|nr:hypothetical protein SAMN02745220_03109 [Desulfopila aestuarii DSM 18488]
MVSEDICATMKPRDDRWESREGYQGNYPALDSMGLAHHRVHQSYLPV